MVWLVVSWCHGLRPTASTTTSPPGTLMCGTWKPRLRGECECTNMPVLHVHRSLPAVVQLLHVRINSTFVQNEMFWLKCRVCTVDP